MKKPSLQTKLSLSTVTLRPLQLIELNQVAGGLGISADTRINAASCARAARGC